MENRIEFYEKQKFTQWWLWLLLILIAAFHVLQLYWQVIGGFSLWGQREVNTSLIFSNVIILLVIILFLLLRLETMVKNDGIYVRFFPIQFRYRHFPWNTMTKIYLRTYSAISDYGGWGMRLGIFGKGKAYTTSGNQGLQLEFTSGKRLLIGTHKPDELAEVLKNKI